MRQPAHALPAAATHTSFILLFVRQAGGEEASLPSSLHLINYTEEKENTEEKLDTHSPVAGGGGKSPNLPCAIFPIPI